MKYVISLLFLFISTFSFSTNLDLIPEEIKLEIAKQLHSNLDNLPAQINLLQKDKNMRLKLNNIWEKLFTKYFGKLREGEGVTFKDEASAKKEPLIDYNSTFMKVLKETIEKNIQALKKNQNIDEERKILWNADLSSDDLSGVDLTQADLRDANLNNAKLSKIDLSQADLKGANLTNAQLNDVDLSPANLMEANLNNAKLNNVDLKDSNLQEANLFKASLTESKLNFADLRKADLSLSKISDSDLSKANMSKANLSKASVSGSTMTDVKLQNANLEGTSFSSVNMNYAKLNGASLKDAVFTQSDLNEANLSNTNLSDTKLYEGTNLAGVNFQQAYYIDSHGNKRILDLDKFRWFKSKKSYQNYKIRL